jgi:hypothetical protein
MDNTITMSWKVRGLNDMARRDAVRTLVDDARPTIVCLQETKLDVIDQHLVFALFGINFRDYAYLPASNTRGDPNSCKADGRVHLGCPRRLAAIPSR